MMWKLMDNRVYRTYTGGSSIDRFYGKSSCKDGNFPEDWTASIIRAFNIGREDYEEGIGCTVGGEAIRNIVGDDGISILVKLLDSAERLVIQAHPTIDFAKKNLKSNVGKTECWYFLECADDACVYIGFKKGVKRAAWEEVFDKQNSEIMLSMLHKMPVKAGDFVFVDGGMPHAIGKGCFMIELQEPSDLMVVAEGTTPQGRKIDEKKMTMGLSREKMFDVYNYTTYTFDEIKQKCCPKAKKISDGLYEIIGKSFTDKFSMYQLNGGANKINNSRYGVIIVTDGEGKINGFSVKKGERIFLKDEKQLTVSSGTDFKAVFCE